MVPVSQRFPDGALVSELTGQLRTLVALIEAGELSASAAMRCRIEGALIVLRVLGGEDSSSLVQALTDDGGD